MRDAKRACVPNIAPADSLRVDRIEKGQHEWFRIKRMEPIVAAENAAEDAERNERGRARSDEGTLARARDGQRSDRVVPRVEELT